MNDRKYRTALHIFWAATLLLIASMISFVLADINNLPLAGFLVGQTGTALTWMGSVVILIIRTHEGEE